MTFARPVGETDGAWVITTYLEKGKGQELSLLPIPKEVWYNNGKTAAASYDRPAAQRAAAAQSDAGQPPETLLVPYPHRR